MRNWCLLRLSTAALLSFITSSLWTSNGKPVRQGEVHVFDLEGHPEATQAYAWSPPVEGSDRRRFYAVLHLGGYDRRPMLFGRRSWQRRVMPKQFIRIMNAAGKAVAQWYAGLFMLLAIVLPPTCMFVCAAFLAEWISGVTGGGLYVGIPVFIAVVTFCIACVEPHLASEVEKARSANLPKSN